MVFNVNEATAILDNRGFAKPAHFIVTVTGPGRIANKGDLVGMPEVESEIRFRTDSVTIPGRGALTTEMYSYGPPRIMAYEGQYPPVEMTLMLSPDMRERIFFERWQDIAIGFSRRTDDHGSKGFGIGYYDDYVGIVTIDVYDAVGESVYKLQLKEAWPSTISGINMNWNEDADIAKILVGWSYRYYVDQYRGNVVQGPPENVPPPQGENTVPLK